MHYFRCLHTFPLLSRRRQRVQPEHLDGEGVRRRRRIAAHDLLLPQLRRRARPAGERGRVRDVPRVGRLHAGRAHERDGAGQGDAGGPAAARVLEPGRGGQRRRARHAVLDDELLPSSGRVEPVAGTPLDFRAPAAIGSRIRRVVVMGGRAVGYDTNYVVDGEGMRPVAQARDPASGRALELWANQPTLQLYTGNSLNRTAGKGGRVYDRYAGFCLETMGYVDAVNHPEFPSLTLRPGQVYRHDMLYKFSF
jgi:hypothetical protein